MIQSDPKNKQLTVVIFLSLTGPWFAKIITPGNCYQLEVVLREGLNESIVEKQQTSVQVSMFSVVMEIWTLKRLETPKISTCI